MKILTAKYFIPIEFLYSEKLEEDEIIAEYGSIEKWKEYCKSEDALNYVADCAYHRFRDEIEYDFCDNIQFDSFDEYEV